MSAYAEVDELIDNLGELDAHCLVLAAAARALAGEISGEVGVVRQTSAAGAVRELRATLAELMERCRTGADDDEDWDNPAGSGDAAVRDAPEPRSADVWS